MTIKWVAQRFQDTYDILHSNAEKTPSALAIEASGSQSLSYAALLRHVDIVARKVTQHGVGRKDRVAIVLPDGPEMAVCLLGVSAVAVCAPLNPLYQVPEYERCFSDLGIRLLITDAGIDAPVRVAAAAHKIAVLAVPSLSIHFQELEKEKSDTLCNALHTSLGALSDEIAIVLQTSGTTSRPKVVPLTHRNICCAVAYVCRSLALSSQDRCLSMMPQFHIGGFVDLLLAPLAAGGAIISTRGFVVDDFFEYLVRYRPTWYQAVPATLSMLVSHAKAKGIREIPSTLRLIRSVAAPLSPQLMQELESLFNVPVIQTYGMTEAAPLITTNPLPPARRKPGSTGKSVGPDVAVVDEEGRMQPHGESGEIIIRGENVTAGYENAPEINELAFRSGWFHTGDQGYLDEEGYLFITGRLKEMINRGGEKVSPYEIDAILLEHPAVAEAMAFAVPHEYLGEDIAAAVVTKAGRGLSRKELKTFLLSRLSAFKLPRRIYFVDEIPRGPTGKPQRLAAAQRFRDDDHGWRKPPFVAPETELEIAVASLWRKVLKLTHIGLDDDFFDLGGDSLKAALLLAHMQDRFRVTLSLNLLYTYPTVSEQAMLIEGRETEPERRVLEVIRSSGRTPIFWLSGSFPSLDIPLISLPTYYEAVPPKSGLCETIEAMAAEYVAQIRRYHDHAPCFLGGYSIGGLIAAEAARQLAQNGQSVPLLFLVDPYITTNCSAFDSRRERLSSFLKVVCQLKGLDRARRICAALLYGTLSSCKPLHNKAEHYFLHTRRRLPVNLRETFVTGFYSRAERRYQWTAYTGITVIYFRQSHPLLVQDRWRDLFPHAEVRTLDKVYHEQVIKPPWNAGWIRELRNRVLNGSRRTEEHGAVR